MTLISQTYWGGMPFRFQSPPKGAGLEARLLRTQDFRQISALYWTPPGNPRPKVAVLAMHPKVDFSHHYSFPSLVAAGFGCLGAQSRNPWDDTRTVHEELLLDLGACATWLKQHRGVERLVLLGNSGGGSLAAYYQAQAGAAPAERVHETPGGAATLLPGATLPAADGLVLVAAHRGQGHVLAQAIDPAVVDERDPLLSDPDLDMYLPANGFRTPPQWSEYSPDFVQRYRAGQRARLARLDAIARGWLSRRACAKAADQALPAKSQSLGWQRRRAFEPLMVVYRTMANLHYVARHLDPSPRSYGSLLSERPDLMNLQLLGFARTCTPEAWLSTWSAHASRADLLRNLPQISEPILVVQAGCDREIFPRTDHEPIRAALRAADSQFHVVEQARHYFEPDFGARESPVRDKLMALVVDWLRARFC